MQNFINKIVIPVKLDDTHLSIAKQAAELATQHGASISLLHVIRLPFTLSHSLMPQVSFTNSIYPIVENRKAILNTWKGWLEKEYGICVNIVVTWGNWKKTVVTHAKANKADVIALMNPPKTSWFDYLRKTDYEYIVDKSNCQVMAFFSDSEHIDTWKNIVIPVADFIPEQRINTIFQIAKDHKIKLHLVTLADNNSAATGIHFRYVTGALKMLKSMGNIQVECGCISKKMSSVNSYLEYARTVNADILMTNKAVKNNDSGSLKGYLMSLPGFQANNYAAFPSWQF